MAAGRPTSCTPEVIAQAWKYIETYADHDHAVPSVVGLCAVIGRARSTVYDWAGDENNDFSDILQAINEKQELVTVNESLKGNYNATIAKLLLGKHGYHDKQDNTHTGADNQPLIPVLNVSITGNKS